MDERKLYFRLYNQSEDDICFWLKAGYKLVAVVAHGDQSTVNFNTSYHFVHRDYE